MGSALVANAEASLTQGYLSCNLLEAYGTATSPYTTLYIYNATTENTSAFTGDQWRVVRLCQLPEAPLGTLMFIKFGDRLPHILISSMTRTTGTAKMYGFEDVPCGVENEPITSSCPSAPPNSVLYNVSRCTAYFNPDLQSGTNFNLLPGLGKSVSSGRIC